ncbi:hypothetical protein Tco_0185422 [Tanacetum coccineum]
MDSNANDTANSFVTTDVHDAYFKEVVVDSDDEHEEVVVVDGGDGQVVEEEGGGDDAAVAVGDGGDVVAVVVHGGVLVYASLSLITYILIKVEICFCEYDLVVWYHMKHGLLRIYIGWENI